MKYITAIWQAKPFTAESFLRRAVITSLCYGLSCLLGLREFTTFLSGTSAHPTWPWQLTAAIGCMHLILYVAFILLVPIWLIAAGLLLAWRSRCRAN